MTIRPDETTESCINRIIEGEEVSDIRKMATVKEELAPKIHAKMQSDLKWDNLEALVRSYEYFIFTPPSDGRWLCAVYALRLTTLSKDGRKWPYAKKLKNSSALLLL
jgi:hypothetical protein